MPRYTEAQMLQRLKKTFAPVIPKARVLTLAIAHADALNNLMKPSADYDALFEWVNNVMVWAYVAQALERGQAEMQEQQQVCVRMLDRFYKMQRVGLSGPDYQLAKSGVDVMDALAEVAPQKVAEDGVRWAMSRCAEMGLYEEGFASS